MSITSTNDYSYSDPNSFDDSGERLLVGLNEAQREAVTYKDGPLLVLAGPGSGKTRVVTHRVAWLLHTGVRDSQIAALTFTNKAADEMKTRLASLSPGNRVWIGTFHRFCAYLLRYYASYVGLHENYAIYDADQSKKLLESVTPKSSLPNGVDVPKIASAISWAKNSLVSAEDYCAKEGSLLGKVVEDVYPAYQDALRKANAVDFDDLLFHVAVLLKDNPEIRANLDYRFRYILVDEYQDTNLVQYAIARALSIDYPNLAATGDPDQSIYGWRGANIQNILNFEQDFEDAKVVRLEQNYRSDKSVLRIADSLIRHNVYRKEKSLYTENKEGILPRVVQCLDQQEEAEVIAAEIASEIAAGKRRPRDYAIFYRINALSRNLEYALRRYGVPFQLVRGLEFFNRKEVKDICSYMQLVYNPSDVISFKRVVNLPARGVGSVSLARLQVYAEENNTTLFEAARNAGTIFGLSTKVKKALAKFVALIDKLHKAVADDDDLEVVLSILLDEIKYVDYLRNSIKTEEDEQRLANIQELLSEVREFDSDFAQIEQEKSQVTLFPEQKQNSDRLGRFLEQIALVNDVDSWSSNDDRVSLMTLHAAKGLEFPVVYLIALEDGVVPHERSRNDKSQLEEERRLLFVGLTRAEEELRMTRTRFREFRGSFSPSTSSRFLFEFPRDGVDMYESVDEWFNAIRDARAEDPNSKIVLPRLLERKEGISQRQSLWEEGINSKSLEEDFHTYGRGITSAGKPSFQRDHSFRQKPDFADVDDPPKKQDAEYLASRQFDEFDGIDEPVDEEPVFSGDFDSALEEDTSFGKRFRPESGIGNLPEPQKREEKKSKRKINLSAVSTGSDIARHNIDISSQGERQLQAIRINSFVRHRKYGVGVVKKLMGPSFDRIATVSFLSGIGKIELSVNDPDLSLVTIGRGEK